MKTFLDYVKLMEAELKPHRFQHSLGVAYTAASLAMNYGYEPDSFLIAGILHDCAKNIDEDELKRLCRLKMIQIPNDYFLAPGILHAPYGAYLAKNVYEIEDSAIIDAIRYHSTGRPDMSFLEKVIVVSDFIEPHRNMNFKPALSEIRKIAYEDIDRAVFTVLDCTYRYVQSKEAYFAKDGLDTLTYYQNLIQEVPHE